MADKQTKLTHITFLKFKNAENSTELEKASESRIAFQNSFQIFFFSKEMDNLPNDILYTIGCLISLDDLVALSGACKKIRQQITKSKKMIKMLSERWGWVQLVPWETISNGLRFNFNFEIHYFLIFMFVFENHMLVCFFFFKFVELCFA